MRKSGWPYPKNPPILNLPNSGIDQRPPLDPSIIKAREHFQQSIIFRSDELRGPSLLGEFVAVGDHLRITQSGLGRVEVSGDGRENIRTKFIWAIALQPYQTAVRVLRQDGSVDLVLKNDKRVSAAMFPYAAGNPVWYNVHQGEPDAGTIVNLTQKPGTEQVQTFVVRDAKTGQVSTHDFRNVLIRMPLPSAIPDYGSNYNAVPVDSLPKPGEKVG